MKTSSFAILAVLLSGGLAFGGVPQKKPVSNYSKLWTDSPFTVKPPPKAPEEAPTGLDDWTLGGVSEVDGGYMITLAHKKNAGETLIIRPRGTQKMTADEVEWLEPGASGSFKLDRVEYGKGGWKDITVHLVAGSKKGTVRFDEKNMTPKASAPAPGNRPGQPGQPGQQGQQPGVQPGAGQQNQNPQQQGNQGGGRQPRQRVLPPNPPAAR